MDNKFPGKDISDEDLKSKFPLVAKKNKNHFSKFDVCGVRFGEDIPIFAGPNMVESRKLILDVAKNVKRIGAHFLRGGAFKPLSFPYRSKKYYETREQGIDWLFEAKKKYNIPVVEDAAHAFGARYDLKTKVGSCKYSDMTVFSFHPVKSIAMGEGGCVTTNNKKIYERLSRLRNHGIEKQNVNFFIKNRWR